MPKDVDGLLGCSLALGMVAAETRGRAAAHQATGKLPWICVGDPADVLRLQADHAVRQQEAANFQLGGPENFTGADEPWHALQKNGGLADLWYMDGGDVLYHPILVPSNLQEFDIANAKVGAERNPQKTEVICYVNDLDAAPPECRILGVQKMAKVSTATAGSITLGVAVGPRQYVADQLLARARVIRAMHERVHPRESGSQPHQSHFAGARSYDPAGATGS